jgi:hypothetical protein
MRVIEANAVSAPPNVDHTFSIDTLDFEQPFETDPTRKSDSNDRAVYSVRERIVEDLKKLAVMETAMNKAEQFKQQVVEGGWDQALDNLNEIYSEVLEDVLDPNLVGPPGPESWVREPFTLQKSANRTRLSTLAPSTLAVQSQGKPGGRAVLDSLKRQAALGDELYALIGPESSSVQTLPLVFESKPDMSYYCLKALSVSRIGRDRYEKAKVTQAFAQEISETQSLAAVHFNPENIRTRMSFELVEQEQPTSDANVPSETKEASQ